MKTTKIAIVGTGPSGVYCAIQLAREFLKNSFNTYEITLFERYKTLATILPTGNGRCNLTYDEWDFKKFASFFPRGEKFLYSIFSRYFMAETLEFFESIGIKTYIQPDMRVFPMSNSAKDVQEALIQELNRYKNIKIVKKEIKNTQELDIFDKIVIATGSRGDFTLIKQMGHAITPLKPALCGLKIKNEGANFPAGVSLNTPDGGIIFTHQGVSGPHIFKISSFNAYKEFPYEIKIQLINPDELFESINANPKKSFGNILCEFIPKSLVKAITPECDTQACHIKKNTVKDLEFLSFTVTGHDGKGEIVHAGGVDLKEIDKNMKSKIKDNLWFCGEVVDIDGLTGGFNLQNCWSTGAIAAFDIAKSTLEGN